MKPPLTTKFLWIGIVVGMIPGWFLAQTDWFSSPDADSEPGLEASEIEPMPERSDADRFWRMFPLPKGQGQVYIHVLGGASETVNIDLIEVNSVDGKLSVHRRTLQRRMLSFESVFIWLASGKKCTIEPNTSWGGVHRDTGLEVTMAITDE